MPHTNVHIHAIMLHSRDSSYTGDSLSGMRPRKLVTEAMGYDVDVHSVHTAVIINVNW